MVNLKQDAEVTRLVACLEKDILENKRLFDMKSKVLEWEPPTEDHQELKKFMLNQIDISMNDPDYYEKNLAETRARSAIDFFNSAIESAKWNIEYHEKEMAKEKERCNDRSKWIQKLRESIKSK